MIQHRRWKQNSFIILSAILACFHLKICHAQSTHLDLGTFGQIQTKMNEVTANYKKEQILIVIDLDNTLLAMDGDLGSDQWFDWQQELVLNDVETPDRIAKNMKELLNIQGILFELSWMFPPEKKLPKIVDEIQKSAIHTIVMTARVR